MEKWVEKKQQSKKFSFVKALLYFCSIFYKAAVSFRHVLYGLKILPIKEVDIPVISVGNIVCGGTGKSEFVAKLIKDLGRNDLAIASRGYRSKRKGGSRIVQDSDDGDEPFMLSQRCKNIPVIVGKKRELSAQVAMSLNKKAVILDDGMQYVRLKKDLQIVMVRADDPFGGGFVPFGMRRELLSKLQNADFIIIHGAKSSKNYELVKRDLLCYSSAKCFGTLYNLEENNNKLLGKKVGVFCGIGNPQAFMRQINKLGLNVVKKKFLADHEKFFRLQAFSDRCKELGADTIICTTKDYVKLSGEEKQLVTPIHISMEVAYEAQVYKELIVQINNNIDENRK